MDVFCRALKFVPWSAYKDDGGKYLTDFEVIFYPDEYVVSYTWNVPSSWTF
jgi:hypothetical protein